MTHSLTIELPEIVYQSLNEEAAQKGVSAEEIAAEILELMMSDRKLSVEEFEKLADLLADEVEKRMPPDAKPLSDYAMSREGIYEDHP
jgi:antitoxin ParD1/3/4